MQMGNTPHRYGWVSIVLHWSMAIALLGMYALGTYMVDLGYYDSLYHTLPPLHKSIGVVLAGLLLFRLVWVVTQPRPAPVGNAPAYTHTLATLGHTAIYGLLLLLIVSGYLISTAKGHGISVFGWFELPAVLPSNGERGEWAGDIHEIAATLFMVLIGVHALAAFFHHFYWHDTTLTRMLGKTPKETKV